MDIPLCFTFRMIAQQTWNLLHECKEIPFKFNEESITDWILFCLKRDHSEQVLIRSFTKNEESKNGADWEWWFVEGPNAGIKFRVQAKIIDLNTDSFRYLHSEGQTEKLINQSDLTPKTVPIYCLYTYTEDILGRSPEFGCSILDARDVLSINPQNHISNLKSLINPWEVLVCSQSGKNPNLRDLDSFVQRYFPRSAYPNLDLDPPAQISDIPESQRSMIVTNLPPYVSEILDGAENIKQPDEMLAGVMVINLGDKQKS